MDNERFINIFDYNIIKWCVIEYNKENELGTIVIEYSPPEDSKIIYTKRYIYQYFWIRDSKIALIKDELDDKIYMFELSDEEHSNYCTKCCKFIDDNFIARCTFCNKRIQQ